MIWQVHQTRRFGRAYKKLALNIAVVVDKAVAAIADNPDLGQQKKGDLAHLWVYKFHAQNQLYLLGYSRDEPLRLIYLEAVGVHENFYRDVKR